MLNLIEQTVRYLLARIIVRHSEISLRTEKFNLALVWVHKLSHTRFAYRIKYILNQKFWETRFENFT